MLIVQHGHNVFFMPKNQAMKSAYWWIELPMISFGQAEPFKPSGLEANQLPMPKVGSSGSRLCQSVSSWIDNPIEIAIYKVVFRTEHKVYTISNCSCEIWWWIGKKKWGYNVAFLSMGTMTRFEIFSSLLPNKPSKYRCSHHESNR